MKDILFRGLWVHGNKEWIEGDLVRDKDGKPHIVDNNYVDYWHDDQTFVCEEECEVLPETVGQYTGLLDKDGKKVFEGDIVKVYDNFDCVGETLYVGKVQWDDTFLNWELKTGENIVWSLKNLPSVLYYEVIGNVHDNPELLEVK